jgi:hypothetical protein
MVSVLLATGLLAACAGEPEPLPVPKPGAQSGPRFVVTLEPGPHYSKDMKVMWIRYTVWPQVAVWLEKTDGTFVDTIYVTELAVTGDYRAAPKTGRPEALPVWSHLRKGTVDAVSSPTTVDSTVSYGNDLAARLPAGEYVVKLETNRSYDWNATYTKKTAGVNGQPSLVYKAGLTIGGDADEAVFEPIGTGSVDGVDGEIRPGLGGIDTALQLFGSMKVAYAPE